MTTGTVYHAPFTLRIRAFLADTIITLGLCVGSLFLLSSREFVPDLARGLIPPLALFIEPVLIAAKRGTPGHLIVGIRVVDSASPGTGRGIGYLRSIARWFVKGFIGLISFLWMVFTRKHQALHDLAVGSVVIVDPSAVEKAKARGLVLQERGTGL